MRAPFTLFVLSTALAAQAQLIHLTNIDQTATYNGQTEYVWGAVQDGQMSFDLDCVLNAASPKVINMRRYEVSVPASTMNSYCWGECYNSVNSGTHVVWPAPTTRILYPDSLTPGFDAYYDPQGMLGQARFRFVWFDDNNPTDSVWTDVVFAATPVGINEQSVTDAHFTAFPSPSSNGALELTFDPLRTGQEGVVEFHDALGRMVYSERVAMGQQRVSVPAGKLGAGLWFASFRVDGRVTATRRVVVSR